MEPSFSTTTMTTERDRWWCRSTVGVKVRQLNENLACGICFGYLIDATTIIDCLHSFCRSCLVQYLDSDATCPLCGLPVDSINPLASIRPDPILQRLVYKLVPRVYSEIDPIARPQSVSDGTIRAVDDRDPSLPEVRESDVVSLCLELRDPDSWLRDHNALQSTSTKGNNTVRRNLLCPVLMTVEHLQKFLRQKYDLSHTQTVTLFHSSSTESLPPEFTLLDVIDFSQWNKTEPLQLFFVVDNVDFTRRQYLSFSREEADPNEFIDSKLNARDQRKVKTREERRALITGNQARRNRWPGSNTNRQNGVGSLKKLDGPENVAAKQVQKPKRLVETGARRLLRNKRAKSARNQRDVKTTSKVEVEDTQPGDHRDSRRLIDSSTTIESSWRGEKTNNRQRCCARIRPICLENDPPSTANEAGLTFEMCRTVSIEHRSIWNVLPSIIGPAVPQLLLSTPPTHDSAGDDLAGFCGKESARECFKCVTCSSADDEILHAVKPTINLALTSERHDSGIADTNLSCTPGSAADVFDYEGVDSTKRYAEKISAVTDLSADNINRSTPTKRKYSQGRRSSSASASAVSGTATADAGTSRLRENRVMWTSPFSSTDLFRVHSENESCVPKTRCSLDRLRDVPATTTVAMVTPFVSETCHKSSRQSTNIPQQHLPSSGLEVLASVASRQVETTSFLDRVPMFRSCEVDVDSSNVASRQLNDKQVTSPKTYRHSGRARSSADHRSIADAAATTPARIESGSAVKNAREIRNGNELLHSSVQELADGAEPVMTATTCGRRRQASTAVDSRPGSECEADSAREKGCESVAYAARTLMGLSRNCSRTDAVIDTNDRLSLLDRPIN